MWRGWKENQVNNNIQQQSTTIVKRSPIEEELYQMPRDHSGNAEAVQLLTDDSIRYNEHRSWYVWTGTQWQDNEQLVKRTVSETLRKRRGVYDRADAGSMLALQSSRENVSGTMWMLQSLVNEELSFFDSAPDLLPAPNGIINLRNGKLIHHDKAYGFTFNTTVDYDPNADYSAWEAFLRESLQAGDEELEALKIWSGAWMSRDHDAA